MPEKYFNKIIFHLGNVFFLSFQINLLIFQNSYKFCQSFFAFWNHFFEILKNNVTNFGYVFVKKFRITLKNFPDDWIYRLTIVASIFFP